MNGRQRFANRDRDERLSAASFSSLGSKVYSMSGKLPTTRIEAKRLGNKLYFTGNECSRGGVSERLTSCAMCQCDDCKNASKDAKKLRPKKLKTEAQMARARLYSKQYHAENRAVILPQMKERNRAYYLNNLDKVKTQVLKYQANNSEARTAYKNKWAAQKASKDPIYRMQVASRRMVHRALGVAGQKKYKRTKDYLDYTSSDLVSHLERQFLDGMSWENYGSWHIDHITSVAELAHNGEITPRIVNCLSNLRPIWAEENIRKGRYKEFLI
jgi:hypothetical protein